MITFSKVKESIVNAVSGFRELKVFQFGAKTATVAAPFGDDSHPLKDMTAIYANTSADGDEVIIGYLNKNQIANLGEKRIFSQKSDSSISFAIHLKNDGTCEIGGNNDFAIRYNALNAQLQNQITLINAELAKIATGISAAGGSYVVSPLNVDFSSAKIEEIKTP